LFVTGFKRNAASFKATAVRLKTQAARFKGFPTRFKRFDPYESWPARVEVDWNGNLMRKAKTHFQQIPVAVVEKLVERQETEEGKKKKIAPANVIVERPVPKTQPYMLRTTF